ncbi:MAG: DUF58 domain-containing protein [Clostridia bacterium]|nr:DUF58 domain-containing protein [Clostridia bacterium]
MAGPFAPIVLVGLGALFAYLAGRLWRRRALDGVSYECEVRPSRAWPGERVELAFTLRNAKRWPLPWLKSADVVPAWLRVAGGDLRAHHLPRLRELHQTWSVGAWEEVRRTLTATPLARGRAEVGPARLSAANPFGAGEATAAVERRAPLVVYPRPFPAGRLLAAADEPSGRRERQSWLFADPSRTVGVRPYADGDPERLVHWPATARTGSLQVRQIQAAVAREAAVFLEVRTSGEPWGGLDRARHEAAVALAAELVRQVTVAGGSFALHSDGSVPNGPRHLSIGAGAGARHLRHALEALAVVSGYPAAPLASLVRRERTRLSPTVAFWVVAPYVGPTLARELVRAARTREVRLVYVGDEPLPEMAGVRTWRVPGWAADEWYASPPGGPPAPAHRGRPAG